MTSFALQLGQFQKKYGERFNTFMRAVMLKINYKLDMRSPVGDASYWASPVPAGYVGGHFRANWQYSFGLVATGEKNGTDYVRARGTNDGAIERAPAVGIHYLSNNAPYAQRIENGWSRQAPQGVVGLTVAEFGGIVDGTAREVNR